MDKVVLWPQRGEGTVYFLTIALSDHFVIGYAITFLLYLQREGKLLVKNVKKCKNIF